MAGRPGPSRRRGPGRGTARPSGSGAAPPVKPVGIELAQETSAPDGFLADELAMQLRSHSVRAMASTLSSTCEDRVGPGSSARCSPRISTKSEQPSGRSMSVGPLPDRRRVRPDLGLEQLELAALELREVEQLVDRDVLLDGGQDHAGRADDLVDAQVAEEPLVAGIVDARDGARHVEVVLGHLADDQVVLIVAR